MWNRACPLCFAKLSRTQVLSRSNDLICPACHAQLELSRTSRVLGSFVGIAAAMSAFYLSRTTNPMTYWTWPMLAAILSFGFASVLLLAFASDLVVRPQPHPAAYPHPHA
jgi:hypothetical protein